MKQSEIIDCLYKTDGIRDVELLTQILDDNIEFEWDSSTGNKKYSKADILNLAKELKSNYHTSQTSILNSVTEGNKEVVHYLHHVSTIENPRELFTIAKVMVIWEFDSGKIVKGYQISKSV